MSALSIQPTFPIFTGTDGLPLENGYIWIGTANLDPQTNPTTIYWDEAMTIVAPQPVRTLAGYPSRSGTPARVYVNSDYSIRVQDKNASTVYSAPQATERISSDLVTYQPPFTGGVAISLQNKLAQTVSVKDFGAVGDGVVDDTAAIQNAIDYVSGAGGGEVYFPTGTYKTTSSLIAASNVKLYSDILFQTGSTTIRSFHDDHTISAGPTATQFVIEGLNFLGRITQDSLVYINANNFSARHCSFDFSAKSAIELTGTTVACQIHHCFGMNLVYSRASVPSPIGGLHIDGTDHYIEGNEFNCSSGQSGSISTDAYVCSIYLGGANHFVTDNIGEFGETGIYVACVKSRFTGNRADRCMGYGWVITGNSNVFAACQAIQCGTVAANSYDGWKISGNLNRFAACGAPFLGVSTLRYGWNDETASATQKNEYFGCSCEETTGSGKFFNLSNGGGFTFGSGWYQFNSGTSLDVSGMNSVYFNYSSPATITAFTGGVSGQTLTLLSNASAVTIQTNAGIKTVSGSNLTMAAQIVYQFTYWNSVWYQHA